MTGQQRKGQRRQTRPDAHGDDHVASPAPPHAGRGAWIVRFHPFWHPPQAEQEQHQRHHLDGQLRERQIRGREPREGDAQHQSHDPEHDQRGKTMELRLHRGTDRTARPHHPQQHEFRGHRDTGTISPGQRHDQRRAQARKGGNDKQPEHLDLQPPRTQPAQRSPAHSRQARHHALEHPPAVETEQPGRSPSAVALECVGEAQVDENATDRGHRAHHQRDAEPVPHRQAVFGQGAADHRPRGGLQQRPDGPGRQRTDHDADQHQHLHGHAHPVDRLVRLARTVGLTAEKYVVTEAQ